MSLTIAPLVKYWTQSNTCLHYSKKSACSYSPDYTAPDGVHDVYLAADVDPLLVRLDWVDASERLPEEGKTVVVFYGAKEASGVDVGVIRDGVWLLGRVKPDSHCGIWKVLKWYYIPEQPEHWRFTYP